MELTISIAYCWVKLSLASTNVSQIYQVVDFRAQANLQLQKPKVCTQRGGRRKPEMILTLAALKVSKATQQVERASENCTVGQIQSLRR